MEEDTRQYLVRYCRRGKKVLGQYLCTGMAAVRAFVDERSGQWEWCSVYLLEPIEFWEAERGAAKA